MSRPLEKIAMHDTVDTSVQKIEQYSLKARVHDLPDDRFRGMVEVGARSARGVDSRLHYCSLVRANWTDAIRDAEDLAASLKATQCTDAECNVFSARGTTAFDTFMNVLASVKKVEAPKLVSSTTTKRTPKRQTAPKLAPVPSRPVEEKAAVVHLRRHA